MGTRREVHDGVDVADRAHGIVRGFHVGEIADGSVQDRAPANRHNFVTTSPQCRHRRCAEIPGSTRDENPHACTTDCSHRSRNVTNENPSSFRSLTSRSSFFATPARPSPNRNRCG